MPVQNGLANQVLCIVASGIVFSNFLSIREKHLRIVIQNWQSGLGAAALVMCLSGAAWAQTADESVPAGQTAQAPAQAPAQTTASTPAPQSTAPAATGQKPLEMQSHEGFWGHVNPMARKKWVNRQTTPIKGG
jgi:hypothetical protein